MSTDATAAAPIGFPETASDKGLKGGALGLVSSVVVGVASTAPAYSLAASLGFVVATTNGDGIVGVKGRYAFGANRAWSVPFYLDIGTGDSDLTWQGAVGLGYSYHWGDIVAMWRYLDYNFKSGKAIEDMNFNGPMLGVTFRW